MMARNQALVPVGVPDSPVRSLYTNFGQAALRERGVGLPNRLNERFLAVVAPHAAVTIQLRIPSETADSGTRRLALRSASRARIPASQQAHPYTHRSRCP